MLRKNSKNWIVIVVYNNAQVNKQLLCHLLGMKAQAILSRQRYLVKYLLLMLYNSAEERKVLEPGDKENYVEENSH